MLLESAQTFPPSSIFVSFLFMIIQYRVATKSVHIAQANKDQIASGQNGWNYGPRPMAQLSLVLYK